jgi:hypothetical protein
MEQQRPRPAKPAASGARPFVERRKGERRVNKDRRDGVRFDLEKDDRRKRGVNSDRRKGNIWNGGRG